MGIGTIATSGMDAAMRNMEEISNNIANVNTIGFKRAYLNFAENQSMGVQINSISQDFGSGRIESTERSLDLSLAKDGFLVMRDSSSGLVNYTRAGRLDADKDGYLLGLTGRVQGYPAANGEVLTSAALVDMQIPHTPIPAQPTTEVDLVLNLKSTVDVPVPAFDPDDPTSYNYRTDSTVYDSLGNANSLSVYYVKTGDLNWDANVFVNGISTGLPGNIVFTSDGALAPLSPTGLDSISFSPTGGATDPQEFAINLTGTTQFAADNKVRTNEPDGMPSGLPVGFTVDSSGKINVYYSNGQTQVQGQLAVAQFNAPQALQRDRQMSWLSSIDSGSAILNSTNSDNAFNVGSVEMSNVDLTEELVKLLGAQHDFQANAQAAQTYNQIMQTVENL